MYVCVDGYEWINVYNMQNFSDDAVSSWEMGAHKAEGSYYAFLFIAVHFQNVFIKINK